MEIRIEGWVPTPLEQALMDGSFDEMTAGVEIPDIPEDLLDVQGFGEAMEEIRREILEDL